MEVVSLTEKRQDVQGRLKEVLALSTEMEALRHRLEKINPKSVMERDAALEAYDLASRRFKLRKDELISRLFYKEKVHTRK